LYIWSEWEHTAINSPTNCCECMHQKGFSQ